MNLKDHIRSIPDFPKKGILFYDISTLLAHPVAWRTAIEEMASKVRSFKPDYLAGIESRGFLIAAPLALKLNCGFFMIIKKGKLPGKITNVSYDLEYGTDVIEVSKDLIKKNKKVVVIDDLLATGGTMAASISLIKKIGATPVGSACLMELKFLKGRQKINIPFSSILEYKK